MGGEHQCKRIQIVLGAARRLAAGFKRIEHSVQQPGG